jgi:hypothetical protein
MRRHYLPVLVLLLLSPLVGEIFLGATTVSRLASAFPLIFFYGGGAVIIRELARRHGPGWGRIVVLAVAYGIVEEGLATQSLFNPDLFNAGLIGGRSLGVNWVWSEWTIGYHVVYSIAIPILLAELLFPIRKDQPWLGWKALVVVCVGYLLSALVIGIAFRRIIAPNFRTPLPHVVVEGLLIVILGATAIFWPDRRDQEDGSSRVSPGVPPPWLVGVSAFLAAFAWFLLLGLPSRLKAGLPVLIPLVAGMALGAGMAWLIRRWSNREVGWTPRHRLALVVGSLPPVMLFGFFVVTGGNRVDQIGQGVASMVAMVCLSLLIGRLGGGEEEGSCSLAGSLMLDQESIP